MLITADIKLVKNTNNVNAVFTPTKRISKLEFVSDSSSGGSYTPNITVTLDKTINAYVAFNSEVLDAGSLRFFKGDKGDKGDVGARGPQGERGEAGYASFTNEIVYLSDFEYDITDTNIVSINAFNANNEEISLCIKNTTTGLHVSSLVDMQGLYLIVTKGV